MEAKTHKNDFAQYLSENGFTLEDVAKVMGVSINAVSLWARGKRVPSAGAMAEIYRWSGGAVQPNSFYDLSGSDADSEVVA